MAKTVQNAIYVINTHSSTLEDVEKALERLSRASQTVRVRQAVDYAYKRLVDASWLEEDGFKESLEQVVRGDGVKVREAEP